MSDPGSCAGRARLVVDGGARPWRDLGAVTWAVLCDLAASAVADAHGWMAPVGAREIGASAGLNKDTAARALAALAGAGIVARERAKVAGARRRSGYRLHLPAGIGMCPADPDSAPLPGYPHAGTCRSDPADGTGPGGPDCRTGSTDPDAGMCPMSWDNEARRTIRNRDRRSGHDPHAGPPRRGGAGAGPYRSAFQRDEAGGRDVCDADRGHRSEGAAEPLNGRQGLADDGPRRRAHDQATRAVTEAQGQLFDDAVTTGPHDRP